MHDALAKFVYTQKDLSTWKSVAIPSFPRTEFYSRLDQPANAQYFPVMITPTQLTTFQT